MFSAIVQLFDWRFDHVRREIPRLSDLGYTHVHVSPPQMSNETVWQWWGRYQPTSYFGIGGPLGSEADFVRMTRTAARHSVCVVVDVVAVNPCGPPGMLFGLPLQQRETAFAVGLKHLRWMVQLGAGWFRFDGAERVPPDFFAWALAQLPGIEAFGEIVTDNAGSLTPYLDISGFRLYDFPLLSTLRDAFAPGGDLRRLRGPEAGDGALSPCKAITFVRNHDIERGQCGDHGIEDPAYRIRYGVGWDEARQTLDWTTIRLAHAYLFGRSGGIPYVLASMRTLPADQRTDDHDTGAIAADLRFRSLCEGAQGRAEIWRLVQRRAIAWQRGHDRFCAINASRWPLRLDGLRTSLYPGLYVDRDTGRTLPVLKGGHVGACAMLGRRAGLFVRRAALDRSLASMWASC